MPRPIIRAILSLPLLTFFVSAQLRVTYFEGREVVQNQLIVRLRSADAQGVARVAAWIPGARVTVLVPSSGIVLIKSDAHDIAQLVALFQPGTEILHAGPNHVIRAAAIPSDPLYSQQWGYQKISAPQAWDSGTGSRAIAVGVIDTGLDYTHPDLAPNVWSAPSSFTVNVGGIAITCPAGSHGFNAIANTCDPKDDHGHGTHVAGIIGAAGNNGAGVTGMNWTTQIMGLKFMDSSGSGALSDALKAMEFAIQANAAFAVTSTPLNLRVLSASWGSPDSPPSMLDELNRANDNQLLFVAAAGNTSSNIDNSPYYPASLKAPNVIAVAATDASDGLASFSNYGFASVHIAAPGAGILSTVPGGGYANWSGTSMAAPFVSGAALLTLSACPGLNTADLKSALLNSADPLPALAGRTTTGARLNVAKTIQSCRHVAAPPTADSVTPNAGTGPNQSFTFKYSDASGYRAIGTAYAMINSSMNAVGGCVPYYLSASNALYLFNDAGSAVAGPITPGSSGSISNSQCTVSGSGSAVSGAGNTLSLTLSVSFTQSVRGKQTVYAFAADTANLNSGWQTVGTWIPSGALVALPPTADSVTPDTATSSNQSFTFKYSSPNGYKYVSVAYVLINSTVNAALGCIPYYVASNNGIYLFNDAGASVTGPLTPGSSGTLSNSQCTIAGAGSSISGSGNTLSLTLAINFSPAFRGRQTVYGVAIDAAGLNSGWRALGSWTSPSGAVTRAPTVDGVTPSGGAGSSQNFTFKYSSVNGFNYLTSLYVLTNTSLDVTSGCVIYYIPAANSVYLFNDGGTAMTGPVIPGTPGTVSDSQCVIDGAASSVAGAGNSLSLTLAIAFRPSVTATQTFYGFAADKANLNSGWQTMGTWNPVTKNH